MGRHRAPARASKPPVTICLLAYGDYPHLARRCLESIDRCCSRADYRLVVGANAASRPTLALLQDRVRAGQIDRLLTSQANLGKCSMMRRMFEGIDTRLTWWFDDDSFLTRDGALRLWLEQVRASATSTVQWGQEAVCWEPRDFTTLEDVAAFVRSAPWYRGFPPPSWRPGGLGEFNLDGRGLGDGRWRFILGGCWMMRTRAIRALDWPDRRLVRLGDDVLLGEAIRQRGWRFANIGTPGVNLNTEPRRGA
jgi:GT2 family glycosyltransferase